MTHKIQYLHLRFSDQIQKHEIALFRGAIIAKVGQEDTVLFHHHKGENSYVYQYPCIQYKQIYQQPAIICLDKGVEAIQKFIGLSDWDLAIGERVIQPSISRLDLKEVQLKVIANQGQPYRYKILNWVALSQERLQDYQKANSEEEKRQLLERILKGNILSMAKGLGWFIEPKIHLSIHEIEHVAQVKIKKKKHFAFTIKFSCNVLLPSFIGLGKSVSIGFGMLLRNHQ